MRILSRSGDKTAQELLKAYLIHASGQACVSQTPVSLYDAEMKLLGLSHTR